MTGNQYPTFSTVGEYAYSNGELVADMFEEDAGATFYGAQRYELVLMLARKEDGSPAATTIAISKPRQNGKSYSARYYAAYTSDFEHKRTLYSAHHGVTSRKMFEALCEIYDNKERFPDFFNAVKRISRSRGYEGIYFKDWTDSQGYIHTGGCIEFSTRTNSGSRGGTYSVIIIDEAQEMTDEQQEGMLPVISAAADASDVTMMPQIIMVGTPTPPSCNGTVFRRMHKTAHKEPVEGVWWLEWALVAENIDDVEISIDNVLELARETNPAMGYRIADSTVINEFMQMSKDGFARERLGWWTPVSSQEDFAIDKDAWMKCVSDLQKPVGKTAYGIKFSPDGAMVTLCGAVCPESGPARISLIREERMENGIQWLAEWLNQRSATGCCVVIDGRNNVDFLIEKIKTKWFAKGAIIKPSAKEVIAAASQLSNEVTEQTVTWYRLQESLSESATTSTKRPISGGWGFGGDLSGPVTAASLALWGARTSKRDPSKKMRIG